MDDICFDILVCDNLPAGVSAMAGTKKKGKRPEKLFARNCKNVVFTGYK